MPIHDDVIPGSDGQPAGQGQLDGGYIPNERHDEPTMTIPVYAKFMGNGLLRFSLHPIYAIHLGNIVGPAGTTPPKPKTPASSAPSIPTHRRPASPSPVAKVRWNSPTRFFTRPR